MPRVRNQVLAAGDQFAALGVALDWNVDKGTRYLNGVARFNEISVGRNWLNQGAVRLLWRDSPGPAGTPTIILLTRTIERVGGEIIVGRDSVVRRIQGADKIIRYAAWLDGTLPIDVPDSAGAAAPGDITPIDARGEGSKRGGR